MATDKNITMKQFNGTDYDTLYPKTKVEQVEGAYTQQQILADSTKTLFGLDENAVPNDALTTIKALIDNNTTLANSKARIQTGSYIGTGLYGKNNPCSLTFDSAPKICAIPFYEQPHTDTTPNYKNYINLANNKDYAWIIYMDNVPDTMETIDPVPGINRGKGFGFSGDTAKNAGWKSNNGKTINWFNGSNLAADQFNHLNYVYHYFAIF